MIKIRIIAALLLIIFISGCAGNKKLSRDEGPFGPVWPTQQAIQTGNNVEMSSFQGDLKIVHERKTRGSIDSPIFVGDKYVGFSTTRRRFVILDRETGKRTFRFKSKKGTLTDPIIEDSLLILLKQSDPVRLQTINMFSGKVIRERRLKEFHSGSIMVLDSLILGAGQGLTALNRFTLETLWVQGSGERVVSRPVSDGKMIYFVSANRHVQAVGSDSGNAVWEMTTSADIIGSPTLGSHLYLSDIEGRIIALTPDRGEIVWETELDYPSWSSVAEFEKLIYFGGNDGIVYCLSADDGSVVWEYETDGVVTAPPVVFGDAVLIGSLDRHFYSLDRRTGELFDRHRLEGAVTEAAAVHGDQIFVGCRNNRIYIFEAK
ncbi:MAG: PQQ-binding-like beta-propeller repeat protein [FCB group bacterium]|nr:PQQ-binding-like beta-propeller repeat protein [FCB group bacterium]